MTTTNNLLINLIAQSQSQKEITINEGFAALEALQNRGVTTRSLSTPPGSPAEGASYIVKATATGAWTGKENQVAYYNNGWQFIVPNQGLLIWVNDEGKIYYYSGSVWVSYADNLQNLAMLGINATANTTNRLTVASSAVLLTNDSSGNIQLVVNKAASSNTATVLYQDNYSGRAEIGLAGDDNFHFKVSPDGSTWNNALVITAGSGNVDLSSGFTVAGGTPVKSILSATAALDFPSIAANSSADLTVTVTGAATGASVELGLPTAPTAGIIYMGFVSAANTVTVRAFNVTGSAINPASQSFRATVINF